MIHNVATLLRVTRASNPEEAVVRLEGETMDDISKQVFALMEDIPAGLGWRSYSDPVLWGKEQVTLIALEEASDYDSRVGQRNVSNSGWSQEDHHAFIREHAILAVEEEEDVSEEGEAQEQDATSVPEEEGRLPRQSQGFSGQGSGRA